VPGINFDGSDEYDTAVRSICQQIEKNIVGGVIVRGITARDSELSFKHRSQSKIDAFGPCDAETNATDAAGSAPSGASAKGRAYWYRGDDDNPLTIEDERYSLVPSGKGTGRGSDAIIHFDPNSYLQSGCETNGPGSAPDELLLHEMVHALRIMQGNRNCIPTEDEFYDNDEKFLAIAVVNVYMSSKGASSLRANYHGHERLRPPLTTSQGFLADQNNLNLMKIYSLIWPPTFADLALLRSPPFNPFRELVQSLAYTVPKSFFWDLWDR
jgi:hypothetical protein